MQSSLVWKSVQAAANPDQYYAPFCMQQRGADTGQLDMGCPVLTHLHARGEDLHAGGEGLCEDPRPGLRQQLVDLVELATIPITVSVYHPDTAPPCEPSHTCTAVQCVLLQGEACLKRSPPWHYVCPGPSSLEAVPSLLLVVSFQPRRLGRSALLPQAFPVGIPVRYAVCYPLDCHCNSGVNSQY